MPQQRRAIVSRQRDAWLRHGYHPNALLWSDEDVQIRRFHVLLEASGMVSGDSLLDVGCGFGDLQDWLVRQQLQVDYRGIDISPELLTEGRRRYPGIDLWEGDLFDLDPPPNSVDWVVLSGTLNHQLDDEGRYARQVIERMFLTCRKGMAFNLLDARDEWVAGRWDLQSFHPRDILALIAQWTPRHELHVGYLPNDFTIVARKV